MKKACLWLGVAALLVTLVPVAPAQLSMAGTLPALTTDPGHNPGGASSSALGLPPLASPVVLPRMSPELALETYERRSFEQSARLAAYSDDTVMKAELPDTKQRGEYELKRQYAAPNNLQFTAVRFDGDGFVKTNVLARLLQSEVDHVAKQQGPDTAINEKNYKFSHKAVESIDGRMAYVYHVKPRKKRVGLFKGKVYIDAYTGSLLRAEGEMVKSPSLFIKKIDFVQDYTEVDGFTLPLHLHSVAKVRIIGRTIVDVFHRAYQPRTAAVANAITKPATQPGGSPSN